MPLQPNAPPNGVNNIGSGPLVDCHAVAATISQRAGASPLLPLDSTSYVCARGPRHTRHKPLHLGSVSEVAVGVELCEAAGGRCVRRRRAVQRERQIKECVGIATRVSHVLFHITDAGCEEVTPHAICCLSFHDRSHQRTMPC